MTNNLSQWLGKEGFLNQPKPDSNTPKTVPVTLSAPKSASTKPTTLALHVQHNHNTNQGKRPFSPAKEAPHRTFDPKAGKPHPSGKTGFKPAHSKFGSRFGKQNSRPVFTNYDPTIGRPTVEKREKAHPTNFLKTGKYGDIRVCPLGGLDQVGENMLFLEWGDDIMIIDTGFELPSPEHLGVDILIPDISYLVKNKHKIRGVVYTHGHLDHIGGVPYLAKDLGFPPMYATRLTKELILSHSEEHGINDKLKLMEINPQSKIRLGRFDVEFFHINHSVPDGVGVVVNTPYGKIIHTSDFKFDHNPSDDQPADLARIAQLGRDGVLLAMVDSTNALKQGHTLSESVIEEELAKLIRQAPARIIVTTFASSIGRISKIVEAAEKNGRTVFLSGRSMERNLAIARKLNYLKCKDNTMQLMSRKAGTTDPRKVLVLSTGSQGEELAALTRMAAGIHADVKLNPTDTVIFSSSPIPGNELAIASVMNNLAKIGVTMFDKAKLDIHVSGHAYADECKLMTALLNPKYFTPIHGEPYMRYGHRDMVVNELGFKKENTFVMSNGQGIVINERGARLMNEKEAMPSAPIMIELGEKIGQHVLSDRTIMADSGAIFMVVEHDKASVKNIDVRSRGFVYMGMQHEIYDLLKKEMKTVFERNFDPAKDKKALEEMMRKSARKFLFQKLKKEPLVEVVV